LVASAALLDAARHWALRVETAQQAQCEASAAVSLGSDWTAIAKRAKDRAEFEHPWLRRDARYDLM
jgi:hypothetical protein